VARLLTAQRGTTTTTPKEAVMNRATVLARYSAVAAAATLLAGLAAAPATARPDPGEPVQIQDSSGYPNCPLSRIGTQFVRCDYLTGAGVPAPAFVPEQ
jgi:hypothetical protein